MGKSWLVSKIPCDNAGAVPKCSACHLVCSKGLTNVSLDCKCHSCCGHLPPCHWHCHHYHHCHPCQLSGGSYIVTVSVFPILFLTRPPLSPALPWLPCYQHGSLWWVPWVPSESPLSAQCDCLELLVLFSPLGKSDLLETCQISPGARHFDCVN